MPLFIGPSHHVFFGALYRRYLWLRQLGATFSKLPITGYEQASKNLDDSYKRKLRPFAEVRSQGFGISAPLNLRHVLDDTPVDSFLSELATTIDRYENSFFTLLSEQAPKDTKWQKDLEQASTLWGRELGGECLLSSSFGFRNRDTKEGVVFDFNELFELYQVIFNGGDLEENSLLLWRSTRTQLLYELRTCPHQIITNITAAHLACHLEGKVFKGFAQSLLPKVSFERHHAGTYCRDELFVR